METHCFVFAIRFSFFFLSRCTVLQCVNARESRQHTMYNLCMGERVWVCVSYFCCLLRRTWSTVLKGDLWSALEAFEVQRNSLALNWTGPKWTRLSLQPSWTPSDFEVRFGPPHCSHHEFIFVCLFIIFLYIIHDICTYQLSLKNSRQTDLLSSCASVAKCLV